MQSRGREERAVRSFRLFGVGAAVFLTLSSAAKDEVPASLVAVRQAVASTTIRNLLEGRIDPYLQTAFSENARQRITKTSGEQFSDNLHSLNGRVKDIRFIGAYTREYTAHHLRIICADAEILQVTALLTPAHEIDAADIENRRRPPYERQRSPRPTPTRYRSTVARIKPPSLGETFAKDTDANGIMATLYGLSDGYTEGVAASTFRQYPAFDLQYDLTSECQRPRLAGHERNALAQHVFVFDAEFFHATAVVEAIFTKSNLIDYIIVWPTVSEDAERARTTASNNRHREEFHERIEYVSDAFNNDKARLREIPFDGASYYDASSIQTTVHTNARRVTATANTADPTFGKFVDAFLSDKLTLPKPISINLTIPGFDKPVYIDVIPKGAALAVLDAIESAISRMRSANDICLDLEVITSVQGSRFTLWLGDDESAAKSCRTMVQVGPGWKGKLASVYLANYHGKIVALGHKPGTFPIPLWDDPRTRIVCTLVIDESPDTSTCTQVDQ